MKLTDQFSSSSRRMRLSEAAKYIGVSRSTMRRLAEEREFAVTVVSDRIQLIRQADLDAWMDRRTINAKSK